MERATLNHEMGTAFAINALEVHLWAVKIEPDDTVAAAFRPLLSADEVSRAIRFKFGHLSNAYTICRGAVRFLLGRYLNVEPSSIKLHYKAKGKPVIASPTRLDFNLSHTDGMMVCGLTRACDIGVDVERLRPLSDIQTLANEFFCPEEADELLSLAEDQRISAFYRCWTRKEAYIKAVGEGLSTPLHSFRVTINPTEAARFVHIHRDANLARSWRLSEIELGDPYIAALAYPGPERVIRLCATVNPLDLLND